MKKILTVLVAVCLVATSCVSAFAADSDWAKKIPSFKNAEESTVVEDSATDVAEEPTLFDEAVSVIQSIQFAGAKTDDEILEAADELYNNTTIDKDVYDEIYRIIENGLYDTGNGSNASEDVLAEVESIFADDSLSIVEKITKVADILKKIPAEEAETILNQLKDSGVIDEDTYNKISDAINGNNSILGGNDTENGSPISGITDFISGLLGSLGIGGSGDGDADAPDKGNSSSSNSNSSDFEGGNATGDRLPFAVAGVAVVAGLALVLTKVKKNKDNND